MKTRSLGRMALALATALLAHSAGGEPTLVAGGVLRVLVVDGSPDFFAVREAPAPGLEREILDGFARLHGLQVRAVEVPSWDVLVPSLVEGKGDLLAGGVTVTPGRARLVDFSSEVFPTRDVVVTRKPHRVVRTLDELREERIGTWRGSSFADTLAELKIPPASIDDTLPTVGYVEALKAGKVTAMVDGVEDALHLLQEDPALQIGLTVGPPKSLAFGVAKGRAALLSALNDYIAALRKTPTWSRLVVKYFGDSALDILKKARGE